MLFTKNPHKKDKCPWNKGEQEGDDRFFAVKNHKKILFHILYKKREKKMGNITLYTICEI